MFLLFTVKLCHFIVNTFFHTLQTLNLNSKNQKMKENKVWLDRLLISGPLHQVSDMGENVGCLLSIHLSFSLLRVTKDNDFIKTVILNLLLCCTFNGSHELYFDANFQFSNWMSMYLVFPLGN